MLISFNINKLIQIIKILLQQIMREQNLEEVKSLGKIDKNTMGTNISKEKPKRVKRSKLKSKSQAWELKGGNILDEKFDDSLFYRPKTKQNKLIYENYLGRIYEIVQDQPPQTLQAIADEILAIIRSQSSEAQKKLDMQALIGQKIKGDHFIDISNVARSLTDYDIQNQNELAEIVAINDDDENEEQAQDEQIVQEQEVSQEEQKQGQNEMDNIKQEIIQSNKMEEQNLIDPNVIDAHWIQNQLLNYYEPNQCLRIQRQILSVLKGKTTLQVQNNLLSILNYEKFQLISLLLKNRLTIYYCVKYHQSQNQKQMEHLLEEMKHENIHIGKKMKKQDPNVSVQKRRSEQHQEVDVIAKAVKEDQISRINKKILDLSLHDSEDRVTNKQEYKFKLPEGAEKLQKIGYEQIFIPAKSKVIDQKLIEVQSLPSWMQPIFDGFKRFNPIQSRVLNYALKSDGNMLVCAPTSAGKTNIALLTILKAISDYRDSQTQSIDFSKFKIVYIAPMKALVSQVTGNLSNRLKCLGISVKQCTGDVHLSKSQIQQTQVIISTPQKWDIITRKTGQKLFVELIKLVIIDQIHLLSDSRGPVLQSIIARTIRQTELGQQQARLVGLSATLPNYKDVAAALRTKKQGVFHFDQSYRPIPLQQRFVGISEKKGVRKMLLLNEILYDKVMERVGTYQMIIFVHSRRDTVRTANSIKDTAYAKNELNRLMRPDSQSKKLLQTVVEQQTVNSKELKQLLVNGIGIHHAGLSRSDRDLVQSLFSDRHLNVLVSTATLAWGVNLPAHTVIIKGTQVYSPELGRWVELSLQDIMQMLGRAGRPRFDTQGQGIILTGYEQVRYYLNLLNMQIPLESQMINSLCDQLNAQIVLGSVNSLKDAVNWLSYTFLYIRMLKNPKYYSISADEIQQDKQLLRRRVNLAHSAFTALERNGLINYDRKSNTISSTFLGKISSFYYIKHASMAIYNSNLKSNCGLIQILRIFSMSIEFKYLVVRQQQKNQLKKLVQTVPVPIKGSIQQITTKISALLQAHISRLQLQGLAINVDKVYITQSASRIMRALFQICLKRGWGQAAQKALQLSKMIDKTMWSCLNPLRQFKNIPQYVLSRLEKKQQFSWQSFYQMNPQQIGDLTKFPKLGKILYKFVHHVPRVQIEAYAQPLTRSCLKIQLTATADFKWQQEYHGKEEPFWLMVLDCNEENILYSYYFTLSMRQQSFSTQFIVPLYEIMHPLYYIKVISDRWVCHDNILPLSFKTIILPSKFSPPIELLDLQPIPASNLESIAKQLRINYLNQIQTQAYNSFINSTQNVFLGAAEGSGKFTLAILAINQALQQHKKVVIIVSHQVIAQKRCHYLSKIFSKKKVAKTFEDLNKDIQILSSADLILTTPEAFDVLTRRWKNRKGFNEISLIVVDNLHLLSENNSTLQVLISRLRMISSENVVNFRLICLSASLADYKEVAQWIGSPTENTLNFHTSVRPNSVQVIFNSYDQPFRQSRLHMMQKNLIQTILHYNRSTLVIVNDKKQARITALDLVSQLSCDNNPKKLKKITQKMLQGFSKRVTDQYLLHIIEYGIGYIYEGMPQLERQIVQQLFKVEGITVLVATHSLKWQFDYKVFMVSVLDTFSYYNPREHRWTDYSIPEMMQLMSIAATSQKDKHKSKQFNTAKFMIYCQSAKKNFYKKFLFEPYPLQSSLHLNLNDHFNSAIVSKSITSKGDGVDWLTWTFMYRRLINNPNFYNMEDTSQQSISLYLSTLVDQTCDYLSNIKCIQNQQQAEEDNLSSTNLAIICSYYYIKIETLAIYLQKVNDHIKLKDILQLVVLAQQLRDHQYKPKQYEVISQLLVQVNQKPVNKSHGLLLLHLYRIQMPAQLLYQCRSILPLCVRLTQALVDIVSSLGFLKPLIYCMQICKMLVQAMWINESPLLQILDKHLVNHLVENYQIKEISDFIQMQDEQRKKLLKGKDIDRIALVCNRYPSISIKCQIKDKNDEEMSIIVVIEREQELQNDLVLSNFYPGDKEEFWWVIVGDKKSNKVLSTKKTLVKHKAQVKLEFQYNQVGKVSIYAICDSYIGCDQMQQLDLI